MTMKQRKNGHTPIATNGHKPLIDDDVVNDPVGELYRPLGTQSPTAQDLDAAIRGIFDNANMRLRSNLTQKQIAAIIRASVYAETFECDFLHDVIDTLLELQVSERALGRRDMRAAFAAVFARQGMEQQGTQRQSMFSRLLGRKA